MGLPLLAGVVAGDPEAGALACLGAYVAAFTNKGGPRRQRTAGLAAAGVVNALAFYAGELATGLFPLALALLLLLVFLAAMGEAVHGTVARLGTMPATALLAGAGQAASGPSDGTVSAALLVLAGGLWYAAATGLLTPAPRLRSVLTAAAAPYREAGRRLVWITAGSDRGDGDHTSAVPALRRAQQAALALHGPGGDEGLAVRVDPLLRQAALLVDLTAALAQTGPPPPPVRRQCTAAAHTLADHLSHTARRLARPGHATAPPDTARALKELGLACDAMRSRTAVGQEPYDLLARAGCQRRLLERIHTATLTAHRQADALTAAASTRLHPAPPRKTGYDTARLRATMTLSSRSYRHALRITAVCAAVFILVTVTGLPHGEWATLAVLRVLRPQYGTTLERAGQRIAGNLIGGTCAALLIAGVKDPAVLAVLLFAIISAGFTLRPVNYAFWVVFGTPLVLLIGDVAQPGDWASALERITMTVLGSAAALLGGYLLWPAWDHDRLTQHTTQATHAAATYLDATLDSLTDPKTPPADQVRRAAEDALVKARATRQHAGREPGRDAEALAVASATLTTLASLVEHIGALTVHATSRAMLIPGLADYRTHARAALTAPQPDGQDTHRQALTDTLDAMRLYLAQLHAQRLGELPTHRNDDTRTRGEVRDNEPVIGLLTDIAACIARIPHSLR
ncbi:FUSC family protein [Streptomyces sp. NRRL F-2664]|uniref:FUSC family protein n=1 Tax=Streptomyces sp. NRRL F-2664 TaxID=1463842 RepID=UPI00131AC927|nr:FUSC family protein [Streptomyces sp. NRRL F-2664]